MFFPASSFERMVMRQIGGDCHIRWSLLILPSLLAIAKPTILGLVDAKGTAEIIEIPAKGDGRSARSRIERACRVTRRESELI